MNKFKYYLFIFFLFFISQNKSQKILIDSQYNCLKDFVTNFGIATITANATGYYNFCAVTGANSISCTTDSVSKLSSVSLLYITNIDSTRAVVVSDLQCLAPSLTSLKLSKFVVSKELMYTKITSVTQMNFDGITGISDITQSLPIFTTLTITSTTFSKPTTIKMSYLNGIKYLTLNIDQVILDVDAAANKDLLSQLTVKNIVAFPDLTGYTNLFTLVFEASNNFDLNSLGNYNTFSGLGLTVNLGFSFLNPSTTMPFFIGNTKTVSYLSISYANFKPTSLIDISATTSYKTLYIYYSTNFNLNGKFPLIVSKDTSLSLSGCNFTEVPQMDMFINNDIAITNSGIAGTLPPKIGNVGNVNFGTNQLTGTIDKSWCFTNLNVYYNKLSGTLPTCFACYAYLTSTIYSNFGNNAFSNFPTSTSYICNTFAPQVTKSTGDTVTISGVDIGYSTSNFKINGVICPNAVIVSYGKEYTCTYAGFGALKIMTIYFALPNQNNYTFALESQPPTPTSIGVSKNVLTIGGTYFSSYIGQSIQSITVGATANVNCLISSSNFYGIVCTTATTIPASTTTVHQLVTFVNGNQTKRVYIHTGDQRPNNVLCTNCGPLGACDLTNGTCVCDPGMTGADCTTYSIPCPTSNSEACSGNGVCNGLTGTCKCDGSHQGVSCDLPFVKCPSINSQDCSGFGNCNNQTSICTCNPTHQGVDCSNIFIQCPSVNSKLCNSAGTCNNVTGICLCNSNHQGSDCGLNYLPCVNNCNGGGFCNNQTGTCKCDGSHQGVNCELPFAKCPSINSQDCSGFGNCNNQTSICTCNPTHQGVDCSSTFIQCPFVNSKLCNSFGNCNNVTGICLCNSNHQGPDCNTCTPGFGGVDCTDIKCPSINSQDCSGNGNCSPNGVCTCNPTHQGVDCSITFIQCPSVNSILCNSAGTCNNVTGICLCSSGFGGVDCTDIKCPSINSQDCSGNGICNTNGVCACNPSHQGVDCSISFIKCPTINSKECSGNGNCNNVTGTCSCSSGFRGVDCTDIKCPSINSQDCSGNGICNPNGICTCNPTHQGVDCSSTFIQCPFVNSKLCNSFGNCNNVTGICLCNSNHQGSDCNSCTPGFGGVDCTDIECPSINSQDCSGNGICNTNGVCTCDPNFQSLDCSIPFIDCLIDCNNGKCNNQSGKCECQSGFTGNNCTIIDGSSSNNSSNNGHSSSEINSSSDGNVNNSSHSNSTSEINSSSDGNVNSSQSHSNNNSSHSNNNSGHSNNNSSDNQLSDGGSISLTNNMIHIIITLQLLLVLLHF